MEEIENNYQNIEITNPDKLLFHHPNITKK